MEVNLKSETAARTKSQKATGRAGKSQPKSKSDEQAPARTKTSAPQSSKQEAVVAQLRRKDGTTIAAIMETTGWQRHSVHGFLAGVVRKKLKLDLIRIGKGDAASYRISEGKQKPTARGSHKHAVSKNPGKSSRAVGRQAR